MKGVPAKTLSGEVREWGEEWQSAVAVGRRRETGEGFAREKIASEKQRYSTGEPVWLV